MVDSDSHAGLSAAPSQAAASAPVRQHVVETLIEERCSKLRVSPLWPLYRAVLYPLLRQPDAVRMADAIADMAGRDILDYVSRLLSLNVAATGLDHVPRTGGVIIASTHPTGIADGIAMYDALKGRRDDIVFFANRDAIRVAPRLIESLIPVEWVMEKRTRERSRETLHAATLAFESGACVVLFASGRIAYRDEKGKLNEQPWQPTVATFARKYDCPVVLADVIARNSRLYYWFWKINPELRDITLFNELLNKRGKRFDVAFGQMISPEDLKGEPNALAAALREHASEAVREGRAWRPLPPARAPTAPSP